MNPWTHQDSADQAVSSTEQRVLHHLREHLRPAMRPTWGPQSCIASCRIATRVLDYFGVRWTALPVRALAFNEAGWAEMEAGRIEVKDWLTPDAHSVGIGGSGRMDWERKLWDGHLLVATDNYLYDPSLDQLTRERKGIVLEPLVLARPEGWPGCGPVQFSVGSVTLVYAPIHDDQAWRSAPDWQGRRAASKRVAGSLIRALR